MFATGYIIGGSLVAYQIGYVADRCPCRQFQTLISKHCVKKYKNYNVFLR